MTKTNFSIKRILFYFFVVTAFIMAGSLCANAENIYTFGNGSIANTRINMQSIKGENTIVLPSSLKSDSLVLFGDFSQTADVFVKGDLKTESFSSGKKINLDNFF